MKSLVPNEAKRADCIALIGFMGAGKSAVGAILASLLGMQYVDLDEAITLESGRSIEEIFSSEGEEWFRGLESEALASQFGSGARVISCGGGLVLKPENVELLRSGCRVYLLEISPSTAVERLRETGGRPLLAAGDDLEDTVSRLMAERSEIYRWAAHEVLDANEASPRELAEEIAARWRKYGSERLG